jgi:transcription factor C subunit 3
MQRMDFILLSIIAAHRGKGILQPELTRISGQDKRSTPLRTQRLHDKGYIEKKSANQRSSDEFVHTAQVCSVDLEYNPRSDRSHRWVIRRDNSATIAGPQEELVDVKAMLRRIFDILNELKIITY